MGDFWQWKGDPASGAGYVQLMGSNALYTGQAYSSGTAVQLTSTSTPCHKCTVRAKHDNLDLVYVGAVGVTALTGFALSPGQEYTALVNDVNLLYVIAIQNGDGVSWGAE